MKKHTVRITALAILLALVAASCSLMNPGSGVLSITVPAEVLSAKSLGARTIVNDGTAAYMRVYLETQQGSLIALGDGTDYYEAAVSAGSTLEIEGIPPLRNANLYVAFSVDGGTDFHIFQYGYSASSFSVVAGATTVVTVTVKDSPFKDLLVATDEENGVRGAEVDDTLYFLANEKLYSEVYSALASSYTQKDLGSAPSGATSLAAGKNLLEGDHPETEQLWINTDHGILTYDGTSLKNDDITGKGYSIKESGYLSITDGTDTFSAAYYQRPGSAGIAFYEDGGWAWHDLYDEEEIKSALEGVISADATIVTDFALGEGKNGTFGYVVSPLGNYLINASIKDDVDGLGDSPSLSSITSLLEGIKVPAGLISSLSHAGNTLYIGTDQGVYKAATDDDGSLGENTPSLVSLPRTVKVLKIRAKDVDGTEWAAVLGSRGSVYLLENGVFVKEYRFYTGMPEFGSVGTATTATTGDIFWTDAGLVVTGSSGAVLLANGKLGE